MNIAQLKQVLESAGVPSSLYSFNGTGKGEEGRISMMKFGASWRIYLAEGGKKVIDEYFDTEEQSCEFFMKRILE